MRSISLIAVLGSSALTGEAFSVPSQRCQSRSPTTLPLSALTERQMQFWEDVEEGLDDIENFFKKKGQDIDRIRQFGKR